MMSFEILASRRASISFTNDSLNIPSLPTLIAMYCEKYFLSIDKNTSSTGREGAWNQMRELFGKSFPTEAPKNFEECRSMLHNRPMGTMLQHIERHSTSLIVFVTLIAVVSFVSIVGNLCLAKVLYSKRFRLMQIDRIVLCLALSELCLVLIDSPTEIYRFLSYSFTYKWLCQLHTFLEAFFSSCIIFYHLLGAFDRFVYIHGHSAFNTPSSSKWYRYVSTKSGSIILLLLPTLCSLPLAVCNCLHANIVPLSLTCKTCTVHYNHEILISVLIAFYILPIVFSFILHGKLIHFIRSRPSQDYLTRASFILSAKQNELSDPQQKRRAHQDIGPVQNQSCLSPQSLSNQRFVFLNRRAMATSTAATTSSTMPMLLSTSLHSHPNHSSNSSYSSGSLEKTSSKSIASPTVLYKINCQANANANRTVLLMILLLSFYVFCWGPENLYTWYQLYHAPRKSLPILVNQTLSTAHLTDLRRFILMKYGLYLLSMVSMCFSFLFYFSLNKSARGEFSRLFGCICSLDDSRTSFIAQIQFCPTVTE